MLYRARSCEEEHWSSGMYPSAWYPRSSEADLESSDIENNKK